jgi:hypothetical protein
MFYTDEQLLWIDDHRKNPNARKYLMVTKNKDTYVARPIYAQNLKQAKVLAREYVARLMSNKVTLELVQVYK